MTARKYNQCYETTWEDSDLPFDRWPLIADCDELARSHVEEKWWHVYIWEPWKTVAQHKSCAFRVVSPFDELGGKIGDDDVRDILRDAIRIKGRDGRVAARGRMECQAVFAEMEWNIYRP